MPRLHCDYTVHVEKIACWQELSHSRPHQSSTRHAVLSSPGKQFLASTRTHGACAHPTPAPLGRAVKARSISMQPREGDDVAEGASGLDIKRLDSVATLSFRLVERAVSKVQRIP